MKIDAKLTWSNPGDSPLQAFADRGATTESAGYDGLWSAESAHDPFLPLVAAAQATSNLELGTAITVAFARNPMSLAYTAQDFQVLSGGRLLLGLGSQVRPHIERRFNMPWSRPAARMREFIEAMRAIWSAWETGDRLNFQGDFYSHTLMTPFFSPGPCPWGPPPIYLAAVGEHMTEVAGAVGDGFMPHPFTTERYLRERTLPTLKQGRASSGKPLDDFSLSFSGLIASGQTEEAMGRAIRKVRDQIAFYGSTPAYHSVLALHGWEELGHELNALSRSAAEDRWTQMGDLIGDEVLRTFAIVAEPDQLGQAIVERYGDIIDRFSFYAPYEHHEDLWKPAIEHLSQLDISAHADTV